jgi:hypothetical protein
MTKFVEAVAFDAQVLKWSLDDNPPPEFARHHIKEASFYGIDTWKVDLVIKLPPANPADGHRLVVNHMGIIEKGMWPAKKAHKNEGDRVLALLEEFDGWLEQRTNGTVDALLLACIGGISAI